MQQKRSYAAVSFCLHLQIGHCSISTTDLRSLTGKAPAFRRELIMFRGQSPALSLSDTSLLQQWPVSCCNHLYMCCASDKDEESTAKPPKSGPDP